MLGGWDRARFNAPYLQTASRGLRGTGSVH